MSTPFATAPSTSLASSAVSSTESTPSSLSRPRRKSPPPPKLNLDELKSIPTSLTDGKASTSTSFVFTSSRTARSLHAHSQSLSDALSPPPTAKSSPLSHDVVPSSLPNSSSLPASAPARKNPNAVLSSVQLARHGQGAVDARCIVSPNMRAAGFVPLAYTPLNGPTSSKPSALQSTSSVLSVMDPPCFPPIVFVNPSNITTTPMWDYQRDPSYGLVKNSLNNPALMFGDKPRSSSSMSPGSDAPSSPTLDRSSRCISSSNSVFSTTAASPLQSRIGLPSPLSSHTNRKLNPTGFVEPVVDGYPFPHTPPRTRKESRTQVSSASVPILQGITESPSTASSTAPGSVTPLGASPTSSVASSPPSALVTPLSSSYTVSVASSGSSKRSSSTNRHVGFGRPADLSLTELCSISAQAWNADPVLLPHVKTAHRETAKSSSSKATSRKEIKKRIVAKTTVELGKSVAAENVSAKMQRTDPSIQERSAKVLPPVTLPAEEVRAADSGKGKSKETEAERHRGRGKDRERRKQKPIPVRTQSSSPTSAAPSPLRDEEETGSALTPKKLKDRAHPGKEKASATAHSSFSSFSFPPQQQRPLRAGTAGAHAHTLGESDVVMERERAREAGEHAKDIVLAHRERDREHARQTESWHDERSLCGVSKKRHAAAEGALAAPLMFATAYDSGYGRGVARGEHLSLRGGSVGTGGSAPSVLSEGDTIVHEQPVIIKLTLDA